MIKTTFIILYFLIINFISFLTLGLDKEYARRKHWRISEKALFTLAWMGGSVGAWGGMYVFRHKTKKKKFVLGIPVIIICQCVIIFILVQGIFHFGTL